MGEIATPARGPAQRSGLTPSRDGTDMLLLEDDGRVLCRLNETAAALWELCDGRTDPAEMASAVAALCDVPLERARGDVAEVMDALLRAGVIEWASENAPAGEGRDGNHRT